MHAAYVGAGSAQGDARWRHLHRAEAHDSLADWPARRRPIPARPAQELEAGRCLRRERWLSLTAFARVGLRPGRAGVCRHRVPQLQSPIADIDRRSPSTTTRGRRAVFGVAAAGGDRRRSLDEPSARWHPT